MEKKVVLVTGGARRIGAQIVRAFHARGCLLAIHCRHSRTEADALAAELNAARADSARVFVADLLEADAMSPLCKAVVQWQGCVSVLVNNASAFYPTSLGEVSQSQWDELLGSNLRAPFFLAQELLPQLRKTQGAIVNLVDIHCERPMPGYPVYSAAKAGAAMLTRALAMECAPDVRVNGVSPGAILWPENESDAHAQAVLSKIPMGRSGHPADISSAVTYLALDATYVTGQILAVDGGRNLNM